MHGPIMRAERRPARTAFKGAGLGRGSAEPPEAEFVVRWRLSHLFGVRRQGLVRLAIIKLLPVHVRRRAHVAPFDRAIHPQRQVPGVSVIFRVHLGVSVACALCHFLIEFLIVVLCWTSLYAEVVELWSLRLVLALRSYDDARCSTQARRSRLEISNDCYNIRPSRRRRRRRTGARKGGNLHGGFVLLRSDPIRYGADADVAVDSNPLLPQGFLGGSWVASRPALGEGGFEMVCPLRK
mmetsp:Transcript_25151/g.70521  ORF Transcript_25151/g.70521 Transcript_25151/m.70521 type:complete len:238 (-) Transcript_25151:138-851(-)